MDNAVYTRSPRERIAHYRHMAAQAVQLAQATDDPARKATQIDDALYWLALAHEVEILEERLAGVSPLPGAIQCMTDETAG